MSKWVCSKWNENPKDGEKLRVVDDTSEYSYSIKVEWGNNFAIYHIPKSHYRLCEPPAPPERWEDVTAQCSPGRDGFIRHTATDVLICKAEAGGYRLRKVNFGQYSENKYAFVVEKKVTT